MLKLRPEAGSVMVNHHICILRSFKVALNIFGVWFGSNSKQYFYSAKKIIFIPSYEIILEF